MSNYLLAVMEAVTYATDTGNSQELADGNATTLDMKIEEGEYNYWMSKVKWYQQNVNNWAAAVAADPTNQGTLAQFNAANSAFQNCETKEQTYTQQADGGTQAMQNQVGQDSTNVKEIISDVDAINQAMQNAAQQKIP